MKVVQQITIFNTIALRTAKTPQSLGRSKCDRVKVNGYPFREITMPLFAPQKTRPKYKGTVSYLLISVENTFYGIPLQSLAQCPKAPTKTSVFFCVFSKRR